jgi:5-methyltetrahydrofolate--homocysteine methyltransferase
MKKAVNYLLPFMEDEKLAGEDCDVSHRATILLATVKGDVHDIGKNIVGVVLGCNNYRIIDLGVMVSSGQILKIAQEENVDIIGLSGLITPSLDEMVHVAKEMKRLQLNVPLLIGGATTSARHTAVRIAPEYDNPVVHVLDASRSVSVVDKLLNPELSDAFEQTNLEKQAELVASFETRQRKLVSYEEAYDNRLTTDWSHLDISTPEFIGNRTIQSQSLDDLRDFIDWTPFFMTWQLKGKYPRIFEHKTFGAPARELFDQAQQLLDEIISKQLFHATAVYGFWPAASAGDDIIVYTDESRNEQKTIFHTLRQQTRRKGQDYFRSLADYVAPLDSNRSDYIGAFALTTGIGVAELVAQYDAAGDDYNSIMVKALADRLAEAFAEYLHQHARQCLGYGESENLTKEELIAEQYRGIRPAPGYPAQPDHTEKSTIWELLDTQQATGMELTESLAMMPAASVSGLYFAHPKARYFAIDRIGTDQLENYAQRKNMPIEDVRRWLGPIL